jgi:FKBP-type peptidyl-prolyl cis-trans isomerase
MSSREDGAAFLKRNATYDDVQVTSSGLQYSVRKLGDGPRPRPTDTVEVNYHGTFIDNKAFDSTYTGDPVIFRLDEVIAGWTEGLQLMPVGSVFKFYVPPELGYGAQGVPGVIPPNTVLIFEVELLRIVGGEAGA